MGRLNVQNILSSELGRRRFFVRPSEPLASDLMGAPGDGIYLGRTQTLRTPVYWDFARLANPHVAVMGMTGSGKSYFVKTFIVRAHQQWGTHALILDWAGEYAPWVSYAGGKTISLGRSHFLNILDCSQSQASGQSSSKSKKSQSELSPVRMRIEQVLAALSILSDAGKHPRRLRYLKEALQRAYVKKKFSLDGRISKEGKRKFVRRMPTLYDALSALKSMARAQKKDEDLEAAIQALEPFCAKGADYLSRPGGVRLDDLIGSGLVCVDLSGLPSEAHRSLAGLTLLQFLKERMREKGWSASPKLELIVVADEAWKIAQDERSDLVAILREGRKHAFGLVVASQNPTDLSKTILSNAGTLLAFRMMLSEFREYVGQSMHCAPSTIAQMERYSVGQCLARLAFDRPGAFDVPFVISRIEGQEPQVRWRLEAGSMQIETDREEFNKKLWRLGCSDAQISSIAQGFESADRSMNVEELANRLFSFGFSRSRLLPFLRSLGVPDADLARTFSRLQARSLGVAPGHVVQLVMSDE